MRIGRAGGRPAIIGCLLLGFLAASPAAAVSRDDWDTASTVGEAGLVAAALGTPLLLGDHPGLWQAGGSILVGGGIAEGLKQVIHEQRPDGSGNDSFPSGHAAVSFAAAATLQRRYGWEVGLPAQLVALFVGTARVEADKHHWYDIAASAAIGEAAGFLITSPRNDRVRFFPFADSHGGGILASCAF